MNLFTIFVVSLSINNVEIAQIGPFGSYADCDAFATIIKTDIKQSLTKQKYGVTADMWGVGNGAIFQNHNYQIECIEG